MEPEDYWLHSSPSSFNEDLRRKKLAGEGEDRCERKRGEDGAEEKVTKSAGLSNDKQRSH